MKSNILSNICLFIFAVCAFSKASDWQVIGVMPDPVYGGQAIAHGDYIYILGGWSDSLKKSSNKIQIFDPVSNEWKLYGTMRHARYGFVADVLDDSSIVYAGGINNNSDDAYSIELWNPISHSSANAAVNDYNVNFNRIFFTGHIYNNHFYLFGGLPSPAAIDTISQPYIVRYNLKDRNTIPLQDRLYEDTSLPYLHMSVRIDSIVYLLGGVHFNVSNRISVFNLNSYTLTEIGNLKMVRAGGAAVAYQKDIYVIGGFSESQRALNSVEKFGFLDNSIINKSRLNYARNELMAVVFKEELYVFGGKNQFEQAVAEIEKLNLVSVSKQEETSMPKDITLFDNYPNPFNITTTIRFELNRPDLINLSVFNMTGELVKTVFSGFVPAGEHRIFWHGTDQDKIPVSGGMYLYRLTSSAQSITKKMLLLR